MTDEPNNPSPEEQEKTGPADPSPGTGAPPAPVAGAHDADAGTLPPPPDADQPRPTPESQAALTGKAPSGSSTSGTTVPADTKPKSPPAAPPSNETPEEKKARLERIIAEAKAKKEAAAAAAAAAEGQGEGVKEVPGGKSPAVGDPAKSPSQADLEKAAKIAEAKARAAALKEAAAAKTPAAAGEAKPTPAAKPAAPAAPGAPKAPVKKKDEGPKPEDASAHPLVKSLRDRAGDAAVTGAFNFLGQLSIHVGPASVVEVCRLLRDDAETPFEYLSDLTCVHWPERDDAPFEVVYNLYSISKNVRVRLKVGVAEEVESVTPVWPAANWMEREVYDLFGVHFRNHPDLRRLLLPADWDGHPFRKDYPLEFMENDWTTRHLPEFTNVQQEQLAQRRAYGLEILQTPDERRFREIFRDGRDPLPKEHK
ncbi:MAG TPA: NADH-quinone oxidoreductase subunit C [Pyrinomonadaceae bacterium]|jgi:NADH-quinone oxidoreductase subunit C|nr:NADH-quinone oxidoreductase subunit C [Pyrinomonadaceae bacterium]